MPHAPLRTILATIVTCLSIGGCDRGEQAAEPAPTDAPAQRTIAVIPKGTQHQFWQAVESGARLAGEQLGVKVVFKGPLEESDRAAQIQLVQQFITQRVSAIALAPLDAKALVAPVKAASARNIPVAVFDSALDGEAGSDFVSFVATDNHAGGRVAGKAVIEALSGSGKVVLLRYAVGSASTEAREAGFLEAIGEAAGIELLVDNRYAGVSAAEAKTASLNLLDTLRKADAIFCPNESSTLGMLLALRQVGLAGKVTFVGFDTSPALITALEAGEIDALVAQNPKRMGYGAVRALVDHLDGKPVDTRIDTGAVLVTKQNLNDPDVKDVLQ